MTLTVVIGRDDVARMLDPVVAADPIEHNVLGTILVRVRDEPEKRGHGYGSAVTAHAASDVLDHHAVPVLYADLANPTSNRIYQAIGFRPVSDHLSITF